MSKPKKSNKKNRFSWFFEIIIVITIVISINLIISNLSGSSTIEDLSYHEFEKKIHSNFEGEQPKSVALSEYSNGQIIASFKQSEDTKDSSDKETNQDSKDVEKSIEETTGEEEVTVYRTFTSPKDNNINELLKTYDIDYSYVIKGSFFSTLIKVLFYGFLFFLLWSLMKPSMKSKKIGTVTIEKVKDEEKTTTFDDIGGLTDEIKKEIMQTQELIKNPELAKALGIKPSKGIILEGPSGTGKTKIARAIANSFDAEFLSVSGSEFVELFAGMGAKKVRELFEKAQKLAPCVIFIDEIDAVAKKRSTNNAFSNEEREQTLNQLLVSMDGIVETNDVLIIAATNRLDMLDAALLRPGRFDYKIKIDLPDLKGREEILGIHSKDRPLSEDLQNNLPEYAKSLIGFSGAEIEQLVNIAAYRAFNDNRNIITREDFDNALDRIILGNATRALSSVEMKKRVAYHEAGHAVLSAILNPGRIRKVTIVPRGGAGGFLAEIPKEGLKTSEDLKNQIKIFLAGGVAEEIIFKNHSYGVDNDFEQSKNLISNMVDRWGMGSTKLRPTFSDKEKEEQSIQLYEQCLNDTKNILEEHFGLFKKVAELLLEKETLDGSEIEEMVKQYRLNN